MEELAEAGLACCLIAGLAAAAWALTQLRRKKFDPFFTIYFVSALVYLEIAPPIAYVFNYQASVFGDVAPSARGYLTIQVAVWVAFLGPLLFFYRVPFKKRPAPPERFRIEPGRRWRIMCVSAVLLSALYLFELMSRGILFRRLGTDATVSQTLALPATAFAIIRVFESTAYFLAAVLILMRITARTVTQRKWATLSLVAVSVAFLVPAAVNSRLGSATFLLNMAAWQIVFSKRKLTLGKRSRRTVLLLVSIVLVGEVALNARQIFPPLLTGGDVPAVALYSPLGEDQGINRLNCVDLIVRTEKPVMDQGPAWGAAWQAVPWLVGRYVDPAGFDKFRATGRTTAKTYMLQRYLNNNTADYYSCSLTDQFGNFGFGGFMLAGVFFGAMFQVIRRRITFYNQVKPRALLLAMFFACSWLRFEVESSLMLFGWVTYFPLVVVFFMFPPIRRVAVPKVQVQAATSARIDDPA